MGRPEYGSVMTGSSFCHDEGRADPDLLVAPRLR